MGEMADMYPVGPDGEEYNPCDGEPYEWEGDRGPCVAASAHGNRCSRVGSFYFGDDGPFCRQHQVAELVYQDTSFALLACLNCDGPIHEPSWPFLYCLGRCRQEAKYVRYARQVIRDGRGDRPDAREALQI